MTESGSRRLPSRTLLTNRWIAVRSNETLIANAPSAANAASIARSNEDDGASRITHAAAPTTSNETTHRHRNVASEPSADDMGQ